MQYKLLFIDPSEIDIEVITAGVFTDVADVLPII